MIVTCTQCQTRYSLEPASLGPRGRTVRCARCGHSWHQPPPPDLPRAVEPPRPFPSAATLPALAERQRTRAGIALPLFLLVLAGLAAAALLGRDRIVAGWPPAAEIYGWVGLAERSPLAGLEITSRMERIEDGGVEVVIVTGEIRNTTDRGVDAPRLRGIFRDAARNELRSWTFAPAGLRLLPGQSIPFSDRYENPPEGAAEVVVVFDEAL